MASAKGLGLERIRRKKGVSLQEIADSTKIGTSFLQAIESEQFEKLPGGIFDLNYIRQYAAAIGMDDSKLMDCYELYSRERESRENPPKAASGRMPALRWLASFVASLVFVAPRNH
ncbi:MAG: helix-turn-helix domain-containing protein [Bryobacteraceae bacterium]|nr:helix-turn-helix domain-containing protein [Bryobacteraceae bacterium]